MSEQSGDGGMEEAAGEAAVQGDGVEDLDFTDALDDETLDDIPGVQLGVGGGDIGEMPTWRGRGPAQAAGAFNETSAFEHVGDSGAAGQRLIGREFDAQVAENGDWAEFTEGVMVTKAMA